MTAQTGQTTATARSWIDGKLLRFDTIPFQARLRITLPGEDPEALGSVIRLDTDDPGLRVCAPLHVEWGREHCDAIVAEAVRVWATIVRECSG
ncbi:hypothetical protein [Glycomyces buryatensis]|uniref:Uncharacterized protein n=1 Tax=Glycomyces buryatensis TaxID=2570927 RepID=A0A4S8QAX1_9ACTN|nr:hypothetical protein [Glycomyces buryatensis]THV41410.1 hypothetical protein FAB82_11460 [Glycomyces buryatensis]